MKIKLAVFNKNQILYMHSQWSMKATCLRNGMPFLALIL
jgi:hypothetical protein